MRQSNSVYLIEKIISCATYFTAGLVGFIWLVVAALMKKRVTPFILYHVFQSIFISIAYFILLELYKLVFIIIAKIPILNSILFTFNDLINSPLVLFYGMSMLQVITTCIILYLGITAFLGKYSYLPWVSDIIDSNTGRK